MGKSNGKSQAETAGLDVEHELPPADPNDGFEEQAAENQAAKAAAEVSPEAEIKRLGQERGEGSRLGRRGSFNSGANAATVRGRWAGSGAERQATARRRAQVGRGTTSVHYRSGVQRYSEWAGALEYADVGRQNRGVRCARGASLT